MAARFIRTLLLLIILSILFRILERFWCSIPNQPRMRRGLGVDIFYWFFTPMVSQILVMVAAAIVLLPFYILLGRSLVLNDILAGYGPIAQIPLWIQGLMVIVIGDFIGYWTHRINHTVTPLWQFHAIHHSGEVVDWLTSTRIHPVNDIFSKGIQAVPIVLLGFSPLSVELYTPILTGYVALIHANLSWNYGPLRYLIASPAFHRWHHEMDKQAWGKNYAGLFPIYDIIFGTFFLPCHQQPKTFGISGEVMPERFISQLFYPFRHRRFFKQYLQRFKWLT